MSDLHPALMEQRERRMEAASILARGILRMRCPQRIQKQGKTPVNSLDLEFFPSVHAGDDNKETIKTNG
jgi:hypothetical protein